MNRNQKKPDQHTSKFISYTLAQNSNTVLLSLPDW